MEASALQAPATLPQTRVVLGTPLLRFRSDEQLVALFRAGHDEAFRAIHERYHKRLFAYARQMLPGRQDAEDALQDVFVRAYAGLRASNHELALRAWLFRVAHNRCIDELRRPAPPPPELLQLVRATVHDPMVEVDVRESLRRLIEDIRRLPEQQRSALLMRELAGMSYADLSVSLGISVGAVKSVLVRARVALAQAAEARDTSCLLIREQLVEAHDRGLRPGATARKHMRDCVGCKSFRRELRGMSRQLAAVAPAIGPLGVLAKTLGFSGGAGGGAAGGGGLALLGGGATASAGGLAVGVNHVATLLVAAMATAGGAVELQHTIIAPPHHHGAPAAVVRQDHRGTAKADSAAAPSAIQTIARDVVATVSTAPRIVATADRPATSHVKARPLQKMTAGVAFGGPVSGASGVSRSSSHIKSTTTGSTKAAPSTTTTSTCSAAISPGSSTTSTAGTETSASASTQEPAATVPATAADQAPCATSSPPSAGTSPSSTSATSSTNGQNTSGTNSSPSGTSTGGSASTSGSGASSSPSTASTGGSASTSK